MTDIAIRVDNLSKLYPARSLRAGHLGALQQRHDTTSTVLSASLRDALTGAFARRRRNRPITDHPQAIEEGIVNILRARCSLDVMPVIEFVSYQELEFVSVQCLQGTRKPYLVSGETRPYVRVGSSNREARDEDVRRLYIEGSEGGFEALPCLGASLTDLSEQLIAAYIDQREATGGHRLGLSWEEMLRNLGCLVEHGGKCLPTHAGIMLFADEPQHFLNQTEVACVRFKGVDLVSYVDRRDLSGPLYQLVDDAEQFIYRHMLYLRSNARITNRDYQILANVSYDTAHRDLSGLLKKNLIRREGKGRSTHYLLAI